MSPVLKTTDLLADGFQVFAYGCASDHPRMARNLTGAQ